jgi:nitroimidazol reductase NimA-like FMN-containing flavoprotein (pyridoxamine 5'-phosphate oxidase superfamily)
MSHDQQVLQGHMMPSSEINEQLRNKGVGTLTMARDSTPYGIPMSFGYDQDALYFLFVGHSESGEKLGYAEDTEEACFLVSEVSSDVSWRSVIVRGPLERISVDRWDTAREALADNAYRPDLLTDFNTQEDPRVWCLDIESKSGRKMEAN